MIRLEHKVTFVDKDSEPHNKTMKFLAVDSLGTAIDVYESMDELVSKLHKKHDCRLIGIYTVGQQVKQDRVEGAVKKFEAAENKLKAQKELKEMEEKIKELRKAVKGVKWTKPITVTEPEVLPPIMPGNEQPLEPKCQWIVHEKGKKPTTFETN